MRYRLYQGSDDITPWILLPDEPSHPLFIYNERGPSRVLSKAYSLISCIFQQVPLARLDTTAFVAQEVYRLKPDLAVVPKIHSNRTLPFHDVGMPLNRRFYHLHLFGGRFVYS